MKKKGKTTASDSGEGKEKRIININGPITLVRWFLRICKPENWERGVNNTHKHNIIKLI